ncbi:MAG: dual specificity protein phosphatase family protein [Bdellovibrionales bacterium]|nr:dual specificity protein phosphatase family protein [Bdellovibrionales bacterium]
MKKLSVLSLVCFLFSFSSITAFAEIVKKQNSNPLNLTSYDPDFYEYENWAPPSDIDEIKNFHQVTESLYRGARPESDGLQYLKRTDMHTILNIENNSTAIKEEQQQAEELGIHFISSPMSWTVSPTDEQIDEILGALQNPENFPIYVHCKHGRDRTGLIIGLYRVEVQGWSPQEAYQEMKKLGFRSWLKALDNYFRKRTGYSGR